MLEETLIAYLADKTGLHVSNEIPSETKPNNYILVQRTGGGETDWVPRATFAVQSISSVSKLQAAQTNETVKEVMSEFAEEDEISSCKLNSDYDYTNTSTKEYRYQAVFDIVYY